MVIADNFKGGQRYSKTQVQEQLLLWTKLSKDEASPMAHTIGQCLAFCFKKVKDSTSSKKLPEEVLANGTAKLGETKKKIETPGKDDDTQHEHDDVKAGCKQEDDGCKHDHVEDEAAQVKEDEPSKKGLSLQRKRWSRRLSLQGKRWSMRLSLPRKRWAASMTPMRCFSNGQMWRGSPGNSWGQAKSCRS